MLWNIQYSKDRVVSTGLQVSQRHCATLKLHPAIDNSPDLSIQETIAKMAGLRPMSNPPPKGLAPLKKGHAMVE
jgi:hypothetical protein